MQGANASRYDVGTGARPGIVWSGNEDGDQALRRAPWTRTQKNSQNGEANGREIPRGSGLLHYHLEDHAPGNSQDSARTSSKTRGREMGDSALTVG